MFSFLVDVEAGTGPKKDPEMELMNQADVLYTDNKIAELYQLLDDHKHSGNVEIQWRIGRAAYETSKTESDVEKKKKLLYEAFDHVKMALDADANSFAAHKVIYYFGHAIVNWASNKCGSKYPNVSIRI